MSVYVCVWVYCVHSTLCVFVSVSVPSRERESERESERERESVCVCVQYFTKAHAMNVNTPAGGNQLFLEHFEWLAG